MLQGNNLRLDHLAKKILLVLAISVQAGCETLGGNYGGTDGIDLPPGVEQAKAGEETGEDGGSHSAIATSAAELAQRAQATSPTRSTPTMYKGTDRVVQEPEKRVPVRFVGDDVTLNFEEAPLTEVVHAVMGEILGLDYIVDHPINGDVTFRTRTPIPRDQLLAILESLLQSNDAFMVRSSGDRYFVSASKQLQTLNPRVSNSADQGAGFSTVVVPLHYVSASEMADILGPVAPDTAFVRIDTKRNLLMLAGTRQQMDGWLDMVRTFDVDLLKGMSVGVFPLEHSSVDDMEEALSELISGADSGESGGAESSQGISDLVRIVPIDRLNSIMVVTPRAHYLERVEEWVQRLDREPDSNVEQRLYVYPVQNSTASRLAQLLSDLFRGKTGSPERNSRRGGGVAPGLTPERVSAGQGNRGNRGSAAGGRGAGGAGGGGGGTILGGGISSSQQVGPTVQQYAIDDVRVVADEENNALLIYATGREYRKISDALMQLDVVATQVIIEASIIEVSLTDELQYGLEWAFKGGLGSNYSGDGLLANTQNTPAPNLPGFSWSISNGAGELTAVLNALAEQSLINVISTPSIMVLDNHTASIHVGDQVPVQTSQTITNGGNITQSVEFRDTGVKLAVTPSVNAGGMVTMTVDQSVTDVGQIDLATGQRSFLERNISSRVAVRSSDSVVLGGLIRENITDSSQGVPLLHSIPVVGGLFGKKENQGRRTELLVVITPRVLYNETEVREVSREMRSRLRDLKLIDESSSRQLLGSES